MVYTSICQHSARQPKRKRKRRTSIQRIRHLVNQIRQPRNHLNLLQDLPHHAISPLQQLYQLLLHLRWSNIIGIELVSFRLLVDLLGFIEFVFAATDGKLTEEAFEGGDVGGGGVVV